MKTLVMMKVIILTLLVTDVVHVKVATYSKYVLFVKASLLQRKSGFIVVLKICIRKERKKKDF